MAKLHALRANTSGEHNIIVHIDIPPGNNNADKLWKDVLLAAKVTGPKAKVVPDGNNPESSVYASSILTEGADDHSWQITTAELAKLTSGDKIEVPVRVKQKTGMSQAEVDFLASKAVNEWLAIQNSAYSYYGWSYTP